MPHKKDITELLRQDIATMAYAPDKALPSSREYAERFGVSHNTIARALDQLTATGELQRVGYRLFRNTKLQRQAGRLPQKVRAIAYARVIEHMEQACLQHGIKLECRCVYHEAEEEREILDAIDAKVDALLIQGQSFSLHRALLDHLRNHKIPFVITQVPEPSCDSVHGDMLALSLRAAHLLEATHPQIITIAIQRHVIHSQRTDYWNIPGIDELLRFAFGRWATPPAEIVWIPTKGESNNPRIIAELLANRRADEAILCNYMLAGPLYRALLKERSEAKPVLLALGKPEEHADNISWIDGNIREEINVAVSRLIDSWRYQQRYGIAPPPLTILVSPQMSEGKTLSYDWGKVGRPPCTPAEEPDSGSVLVSVVETEPGSKRLRDQSSLLWPLTKAKRIEKVIQINTTHFQDQRDGEIFSSIDIKSLANHSTTGKGGWFGTNVLYHLKPKKNTFHGIPFELVVGAEPGSLHFIRMQAPEQVEGRFADSIQIAIGRKVHYFYLLHAGAYCRERMDFGKLDILQNDGRRLEHTLTAATPDQIDLVSNQLLDPPEACLADWWPGYPYLENQQTLPVIITPPDNDPLHYERHLYVHRWVNPYPEVVVETLRIHMQSGTSTRYGLLALTAGHCCM
ncbi:MAG: GntR family transcriptional regulator [Verrucomicrobiota bacterium]|nr:GntR family transcriptional regulator [Verrucomicrobiota bacterium]